MLKISNEDIKDTLIRMQTTDLFQFEQWNAVLPPHRFSLRSRIRFRYLLWRNQNDYLSEKANMPSGPSPVKRYIPVRKLAVIMIAILLAILTFSFSAIAVRNAFELIEKIFPWYSEIRYENPVVQEQNDYVLYELTYIPEGFVLVEEESCHINSSGDVYTYYANGDLSIIFEQENARKMKNNIDTEKTQLISLSIDGKEGYYFSNPEMEVFFWVEGNYYLSISACVDKETLIKIVKGVRVKD